MEITKGELKLISRLLEMAGNEFSNHGCNDMDQALWDEIGFTPEDRATLIHEMQLWNGDTEDPYPTKLIHMRDDMVMNFYADKLKNANLAGMETRCPKCGSNDLDSRVTNDVSCGVYCRKCKRNVGEASMSGKRVIKNVHEVVADELRKQADLLRSMTCHSSHQSGLGVAADHLEREANLQMMKVKHER